MVVYLHSFIQITLNFLTSFYILSIESYHVNVYTMLSSYCSGPLLDTNFFSMGLCYYPTDNHWQANKKKEFLRLSECYVLHTEFWMCHNQFDKLFRPISSKFLWNIKLDQGKSHSPFAQGIIIGKLSEEHKVCVCFPFDMKFLFLIYHLLLFSAFGHFSHWFQS